MVPLVLLVVIGVALMLANKSTMAPGAPFGSSQSLILHRDRANGVRMEIQGFLDWWDNNGPFLVAVAPDGGLRTQAQQAALYAIGRVSPGDIVTNAETLDDTPHGRGAAIDLVPVVDGKYVYNDWTYYQQLGELAESKGFSWGGRWVSLKRDGAHVEIPNWRSLPYPVPEVS